MKQVGLVLVLLVSLLAGMLVFNRLALLPEGAFRPDRCTRFCHDHGCSHLEAVWIQQPLEANMRWLQDNPLGWSYERINLFLYGGLLPLIILFLLVRIAGKIIFA